jgi:hypothetical protein
LQHKSVSGSPDAVEEKMRQFLRTVRVGFERETRALHRMAGSNGRSPLNHSANSIQLASSELAYAYLVRRALVMGRFDCPFEFEKPYLGSDAKADLVLHIPLRDQKFCQAAIEIKWLHSENGWRCIADDARKVLRSSCGRKFLLVFPMRAWPTEHDSPTNSPPICAGLLKSVNDFLSFGPEKSSMRMTWEEEFVTWREEGDKIPFCLTLFEVIATSKRLAVGTGS